MHVAIFGYSVNLDVYKIWNYNMQPSCCRSFSAAKILPNPKLKNKRKFFLYKVLASNTASLHRSF